MQQQQQQHSQNHIHQQLATQQRQQQQQGQDSRRTLIKNQLYLIEHLQLENANLRNERDQLQLENEELKFQLQMISSSNILGGQSMAGDGGGGGAGSAFEDRQLAKLTDTTTTAMAAPTNDEVALLSAKTTIMSTSTQASRSGDNAAGLATGENNLSQGYRAQGRQANHVTRPVIIQSTSAAAATKTSQASTRATIDNERSSTVAAVAATASDHQQLLTKITATPVRQPLRLMNCDDQTFARSSRDTNEVADNGRDPLKASELSRAGLSLTNLHTSVASQPTITKTRTATTTTTTTTNMNVPVHELVPSSSPSSSSSSSSSTELLDQLAAAAAAAAASAASNSTDDEQDDAGGARTRLVQKLYGDCDKAQAAAVVIQRAFRKHQICKRFRMITDQLRHAAQQPATVIMTERQEIDMQDQKQQRRRTRRDSMEGRREDSAETAVPYASGATRAAAWESLSQAANRLAASAAAARQEKAAPFCDQQVVDTTTTIKTTLQSNGQRAIKTTSSSSTLASDSSGSSGRGTATMTTRSTTGSAHEKQQHQQVVATALSFQQLESIRKRQYRVGLNIFNKSPEKGISFLIAHSFIDCSPPYTKSSSQTTTSYYLSNQLHFIDKQHCLAAGATRQATRSPTMSSHMEGHGHQTTAAAVMLDAANRESCRFCFEEENLKMNVAHFLLHRKGLAKERIGQYLGNLQCKFNQDVLIYYLQELDFYGLQVDVALRKFSTTVRMPGEAQKIERFVDRFAARYVECQQQHQNQQSMRTNSATDDFMTSIQRATSQQPPILLTSTAQTSTGAGCKPSATDDGRGACVGIGVNKNNLILLTKDEIFILTFAIIMLNTDLHSPSLKSTSRMSSHQFINNLRGVFKSQTINESDLIEIYERVKAKQITTMPDHVTHVMKVQQGLTTQNFREKKELPNLCVAHRRLVCFCRLFEVFDVNKKERPGQHQREIFLFNDMLLVTKLARGRARANAPQQYTYRQSIMLKGLYVQLFRSAHYCFGIRLCQRSSDDTLIMFNARNELDQSRFVDDLNESIAEMDEMETIRAHNIVETIHFKQQDRLRRHQMMHDPSQGLHGAAAAAAGPTEQRLKSDQSPARDNAEQTAPSDATEADDSFATNGSGNVTVIQVAKSRRMSSSKFSSMCNLASLAESECENDAAAAAATERQRECANKSKSGLAPSGCALRPNRSFAGDKTHSEQQSNSHKGSPQRLGNHLASTLTNGLAGRILRSCSTNSVHSLDSGLFLSRDVSPNQSG